MAQIQKLLNEMGVILDSIYKEDKALWADYQRAYVELKKLHEKWIEN